MIVREFTEAGVRTVKQFLSECRSNPALAVPREMLEDAALTREVTPTLTVEPRRFGSRREAADYFANLLAPLPDHFVAGNAGLWTWLTLFFFDEVCPARAGKRTVRNDYHYIFEPKNQRHFYRHLLFVAWRIRNLAPTHNRLFLDRSLAVLDGVTTEVMKRLFLTRVKCVFEVLDRLYWDEAQGDARMGIVGQAIRPGDLTHRFPIRMRQLEKTYDLVTLPADQLIDLLGSEFDFSNVESRPKRKSVLFS
jgi:hypothetical protein